MILSDIPNIGVKLNGTLNFLLLKTKTMYIYAAQFYMFVYVELLIQRLISSETEFRLLSSEFDC